jgi:hypothetical protein
MTMTHAYFTHLHALVPLTLNGDGRRGSSQIDA